MNIVNGDAMTAFVGNLRNKDRQVGSYSVDLTVKSISQLEGVGRVDFSGKDFAWGQRSILSPKQTEISDPRGWWRLPAGQYLVRLNEGLTLPPNSIAMVLPHERICQNGAYHPALFIQAAVQHIEVLLQVGNFGIEIKENARISYVLVFDL